MRLFFSIITAFLTINANANTDAEIIATAAAQLGKLSRGGVMEYQLSGSTKEELLLSLVEAMDGELDEDEALIIDNTDVEASDETSYGTTDWDNTFGLTFGAMDFMDEDSEADYTPAVRDEVKKILNTLKGANVIYSWNPHGDNVCGMVFTNPVLIDPETKKAYEINFYGFEGGC